MADAVRRLPSARLDPARLAQRRAVAGLVGFLAVFAILLFAVETLSQVGVERPILMWLTVGFSFALPALAAIAAPTISRKEFDVAGRRLSVAAAAAATVAATFGSVFAIGLAALFFRDKAQMSALVLGLGGGCLLHGMLFAPYVRRGAPASLGGFLAARFGGAVVTATSAAIAAIALLPMLTAELSLAGRIGRWTLGISERDAMILVAVLMLLPPLVGGMRGLTRAAALQFVLGLTALGVASFWISASATGYILPLQGYVAAAARLEAATPDVSAIPAWGLAATALATSLGIAALPTLLLRAGATSSSQTARSSVAWTLFFVAAFAIASVSMAAVARWGIEDGVARAGQAADLMTQQPWIADWAARDGATVSLCGAPVAPSTGEVSTCAPGTLEAGDLAIDPDIALLAASDIAGIPALFGMLVAAACLVAAVACGSLLVFAMGRSIGRDLLFRALMPRAPTSRQLLVERLVLIIVTALALEIATRPPADYLTLALTSLSLAASGLFPVMLAAVWWRRANRFGASAGMLVGIAMALFLAAAGICDASILTWLDPIGLTELARWLAPDRAPLVAVPAGLLAIVLVSLATRAPGPEQSGFARALQAARDLPAEEEIE